MFKLFAVNIENVWNSYPVIIHILLQFGNSDPEILGIKSFKVNILMFLKCGLFTILFIKT